MPKLLIFAPCERVIISQEGLLSLITVLEGFSLHMSSEDFDELPDDAMLPQLWHVVAKWNREDNEDPKHWQQRVQVVAPNGRVSTDSTLAFDLVANTSMRNILAINAFPIKPLGECRVRISLRGAGEDDTAWKEIATYPINVQNVPPPEQ